VAKTTLNERLMNQNEQQNRQRALTNRQSSYDNVQGLLSWLGMREKVRQRVRLQQRIFVERLEVGQLILELLVDRDRFLKCTVVS
jgi:hypothetical protein